MSDNLDKSVYNPRQSTQDKQYTERLLKKESVWWKQILDVQAPYRWNLRRLKPGFTLETGCGIGRNLKHLNGNGVGVDHSSHSISISRLRGMNAFTTEEFKVSSFNRKEIFDSILCSHVLEHMTIDEAVLLLKGYLYLLKPGGIVILITPQEAGYRADSTHAERR